MKKLYFATDLVDDPEKIEKYKEHHRNFWPELAQHTLRSGIHSLELLHVGNRLVMVWEVEDDFDPDKEIEMDPFLKARNDEWQELMSGFQKPLPQAKENEVWVEMEKIFDLRDFI